MSIVCVQNKRKAIFNVRKINILHERYLYFLWHLDGFGGIIRLFCFSVQTRTAATTTINTTRRAIALWPTSHVWTARATTVCWCATWECVRFQRPSGRIARCKSPRISVVRSSLARKVCRSIKHPVNGLPYINKPPSWFGCYSASAPVDQLDDAEVDYYDVHDHGDRMARRLRMHDERKRILPRRRAGECPNKWLLYNTIYYTYYVLRSY